MSKSEENLLTPKCSDGTNYRMSWSGPGASELSASDNEGTPPLEDLNPSNFYSEPVLITGKPPVIPPELRQVPAISKPDKCPVSSPFGGEEKHMAEKTLLMIKKAFSESGSDLQCLIADSRSLLKAENKSTEKVAESEADLQTSVTETITQISPAAGHSNKKSNVKLDISDATKNPAHTEALSLVAKEHCAFQNLNDSVKTENCVTRNVLNSTFLMSENDKCPLSFNSHDCVSCEQSNIISKEAKSQQSITNEDQGLILSAKAREAEIPDSAVIVKSGLDIPQSEGTCHAKPHLSTVQSSDSKSSVIVKRLRVSDHIQRFNNLSLNDPGGKKVKSPLSFERTPVRQSVRRINSLSEIRKQTSASILMNSETIAAPLQKSVSCSSTFASRVELVSKNSAPSKPCSVFLNIQPTSSLAAQRNSALRTLRSNGDSLTRPDRLGTNPKVNDPEVGIMQSKSVLEDLTNQETPRTTGKGTLERKQRMGNTVATNEAIGLARKLSGKEKIRYKGSPKNPISKTQLLPTSRPLEL